MAAPRVFARSKKQNSPGHMLLEIDSKMGCIPFIYAVEQKAKSLGHALALLLEIQKYISGTLPQTSFRY